MVVTPSRYEEPLPIREPLVDARSSCRRSRSGALAGRNTRLRRYGKTSLLRRMVAELPASGGSGVYVDLYGVVSVAEVIARLERALRAAPLPRAPRALGRVAATKLDTQRERPGRARRRRAQRPLRAARQH